MSINVGEERVNFIKKLQSSSSLIMSRVETRYTVGGVFPFSLLMQDKVLLRDRDSDGS